jgi:hypothetical protein
MAVSDPEPFHGKYDWDEAFRQAVEAGEEVYYVSEEMRARIY